MTMYEIPATNAKSKPPSVYRQSSRQGLVNRSHSLPMGRWHMKSLVVTTGLILILFYYFQKMEVQPGSKTKKRDLVVRPGKPYKSPYTRRRHTKPLKEEIRVPPLKVNGSGSSLHFVTKSDSKTNKLKFSSQLPGVNPTERITVSSNHRLTKYNGMSNGKTSEKLKPISQAPGQKQTLDQQKTKRKSYNKNSRFRFSENSANILSYTKIPDEKFVKNPVSMNSLLRQWLQNPQDNSLKFTSSPVQGSTAYNPIADLKIQVPEDMKNKALSKQVMKIHRTIPEGLEGRQSFNQIPKFSL